MQATLHQVPLLACGVVFALSILTSDSRKDVLLCISVGVWFAHIAAACVSLVMSLKDIRGWSALSQEELLVGWLNTGITALNTVGYSLMILNVCWYIYSPSLIRLILHIVLAKLHISFMTMLLHMSEVPDDDESHESAAEWVLSKQEEKPLAGLSVGTSLV
ncbi:hypothetical protein FOMPIDRAFT_1054803 [Fomitopsis schrenkii]|uniref:Uncharacterized protein n=1 Tax=Fomitopsis schrenkii TaxID=2126942 RepID=S8F7E0_FOMSC|nr:hypothetical protein FOMPIDRAFT_1054803 [Fomitopsis schrenkii]